MKLSRLKLHEKSDVDEERSHMIQRIIHLTLDILYLLTGEDYIVLKMAYGRVTHSSSPCISGGFGRTPSIMASPPSPTCEMTNDKKVLEVTQKMIELLTGEEGRRSVKEERSTSQSVKQEDDGVLQSGDGSSNRNTPERCPPPLDSWDEEENALNNTKTKDGPQNTAALRVKEEENPTEVALKARKRGRPRKRRILEGVSSRLSPPSSEDIRVITEDFQGKAMEVVAAKDDQQEEHKKEATKDHHTGWSHGKLPSVSVIEVGEDENDGEETSKRFCDSKRWLPPTQAALCAITEDEREDSRKSPSKESDWEISAEGSIHSMASNSPSPSRDNGLEDAIVKVSLDDVQEASEPRESMEQSTYCNGKRKTFTCLDCGRYFGSLEVLESHHKVHTGEAPFSCIACGSSFSSSEELGGHVRFHNSEKLFACSQCGKCFTIKANLIAHRRVHTGNKPFSCAECGRHFALRSSLETHLPIHTLEKSYPCALCGKCFTNSGRLAVHQTTHTGEKTYECEDCGKIFTTSSSMNRHRRTHTGEKPYSCTVCGKCFNRETNLYRHQMIHTR